MEPTGAETQTILEALKHGFASLNRRADATDRRFDTIDQRFDTMDQRFEDMHALIVTVKEAAEFQSVRIDELDTRLTARIESVERRMERGFDRVDERLDNLAGEIGRGRRGGRKRDD